jgi:hypothetical protein
MRRLQEVLQIGHAVQIRKSSRLPLAGMAGRLSAIQPADPYGPYVVAFDNGLQYRYRRADVVLIPESELCLALSE